MQRSGLHKDDLGGLPLFFPLDNFALLEACFLNTKIPAEFENSTGICFHRLKLKSLCIHLHSDLIDSRPPGINITEKVLRVSRRYNMLVEYSVPFSIIDEPIIAAAHNSAFGIRLVFDFIPCLLVELLIFLCGQLLT